MRRISILMVTAWFLGALVVLGGIGSIVRSCDQGSRKDAIAAESFERCVLQAAEGGNEPDPCNARPFFAKVKGWLADPKYQATGVTELFQLGDGLKKSQYNALLAIEPSKGWEPALAVANDPLFDKVGPLLKKYPFDDVLAGKAKPSATMVVEREIPFWDLRFWRMYYLLFTALFAVGLGLTAYLGDGKHPVTQYPWRRVDACLMAAATAPATGPLIVLYGIYRLFTAEWTPAWAKMRHVAIGLGYQLRIVRRMPAPVLAPVTLHGVATAQAAQAPAEEKTDDADTQWFVVRRGAFLGIEHLLAAAGVEVYPITLRVPGELNGFAVAADRLADFERVLGPLAADPSDEETDVERTALRTYSVEVGDVQVEKMENDANGNRMRWIAQVASARAGGVSIMVNSPDDAAQPPEGDGDRRTILLMHCATPASVAEKTVVRRLYGKDLDKPLEGIAPDPERGIVIRDPDGTPVAQVVGNVVYTLVYSMLSLGTDWSLETLARIIHEALAACLAQEPDAGETDEGRRAAWRAALAPKREAYVDLCFGRMEAQRDKLRKAVEECETAVVEAGDAIRKSLAKKKKKEGELDAFMAKDWPGERDRLAKEFDELVASPYVVSAEANRRGVEVFTKTIAIAWRGKKYRIGRFKLTLGDDGRIDIANVANTARGTRYEHPHVRDSRATCWGNMHAAVMELMAERRYAVVVTMIYRFLESYNPHAGVADIAHWKEENDV